MKKAFIRRALVALALAVAILLPGSLARAEMSASISGGTLKWNAVTGAVQYICVVIGEGGDIHTKEVTGLSLDLNGFIDALVGSDDTLNTGSFTLRIEAYDSSIYTIDVWYGSYEYVSPVKPKYEEPEGPVTKLADSASLDMSSGVLSWASYSNLARLYWYSVDGFSKYTQSTSVNLLAWIDELVNGNDLPYATSFSISLTANKANGDQLDSWEKTISYTPKVTPISIDDSSFTANDIESTYTYTGSPIRPDPTMVAVRSRLLTPGVDYTVSYGENTAPGTGTVVFTGIGRYTGQHTVSFTIVAPEQPQDETPAEPSPEAPAAETPAGPIEVPEVAPEQPQDETPAEPSPEAPAAETPAGPIELSECAISISAQTYSGKALKPVPTISYGGQELSPGTDFTVAYRDNKNVGTATAALTGTGNYTGTVEVTFAINPKGVSLSKLKAGKKKFTASWKQQKKFITGYQIEYSASKDFSGSKTKKIKGAKKTSVSISKLKSKKKYYVRIRTYYKSGGKTYYSAWSKVKSVKTK